MLAVMIPPLSINIKARKAVTVRNLIVALLSLALRSRTADCTEKRWRCCLWQENAALLSLPLLSMPEKGGAAVLPEKGGADVCSVEK
jgi:hypothetical protein